MAAFLESLQCVAAAFQSKSIGVIDALFPPKKRAEVLSRLKTWAVANPKLAGFLLAQLALSGFPLFLFGVFTVTVFVFSLIVALLVAVLVALLFTAFMVFVAILVVLPTTFITTMGASFVFLWGLGGYYIIKGLNQSDGVAPDGSAIGDKLNNLTGGRMSFFMDGMRKQDADGGRKDMKEKDAQGLGRAANDDRKDTEERDSQTSARPPNSSGPRKLNREHIKNGMNKAADADNVKQKASETTNSVSSVKGAAGSTTSLV